MLQFLCVCMHVYICTHTMYIFTHAHIHARTCTHAYIFMLMFVCVYMHVYILYTYMYICTHVHIHACTCTHSCFPFVAFVCHVLSSWHACPKSKKCKAFRCGHCSCISFFVGGPGSSCGCQLGEPSVCCRRPSSVCCRRASCPNR